MIALASCRLQTHPIYTLSCGETAEMQHKLETENVCLQIKSCALPQKPTCLKGAAFTLKCLDCLESKWQVFANKSVFHAKKSDKRWNMLANKPFSRRLLVHRGVTPCDKVHACNQQPFTNQLQNSRFSLAISGH